MNPTATLFTTLLTVLLYVLVMRVGVVLGVLARENVYFGKECLEGTTLEYSNGRN